LFSNPVKNLKTIEGINQMPFTKEDELGALWEREGKNGRYLTGKINGVEVVVFWNAKKQAGEKTPDWRVYKSQPRVQK
jgi:hypothetical protein